jgi:hypothetical protein
MVVGMLLVQWTMFTGKADVLFTSYVPLRAHPAFYGGVILFAVGRPGGGAVLRHAGGGEAREDVRGLGAADHLRRDDGGDHRGDHAAARRGHLHPDLLLVAGPG